MKKPNNFYCDICKNTSEDSSLVSNPSYFIKNGKIIPLAHQGKFFCCDCLHDELIILGAEEDEEK